MGLYFFPTIYLDSTGDSHVGDNGAFVRYSNKVKTMGYGEAWEWIKVVKVFPYVYKTEGQPFFDIADMFIRYKR